MLKKLSSVDHFESSKTKKIKKAKQNEIDEMNGKRNENKN